MAYIGVDGKARKVGGVYVGVDGKARKVVKAYVGDANGKARTWWSGGEKKQLEDYTWDEILAACSDGSYKTKFEIGDTKTLDLGSEGIIPMQIVAFDADEKADGTGYAPITWVSERLLATSHRMNLSNSDNAEGTGTIGGWEKTEMRSYLKDTIKTLITDVVRSRIIEVKKYTRIYNTARSAVNNVETHDDVWIPNYREVFGGTGYETHGPIYNTVFKNSAMRQKMKVNGSSAALWWMRSAYSATNFRYVHIDGSANNGGAGNSMGVAIGFCT